MGIFGNARRFTDERPQGRLPNVKTGDGFSITPGSGPKQGVRRGIFGRMGSWFTPERMQIIGATMQQLDGQQGAIDDVMGNIRQDTLEQRQAKEDAAQQQALAAALQTIEDPQLRRLAMMYPEQFARQQFSRSGADEWSEPFAFEDGMAQRNLRTGQVRVLTRPQSPLIQFGSPEDAQDWDYQE